MNRILLVGIGGSIGSMLRYVVSDHIQQSVGDSGFPYGTLVVNIIGCFIIGFLSQLAVTRGILTGEARALIVVGILGGFTTFSSFGNESMNLILDGESFFALVNVGAHVIFGLGAVWLGRVSLYLIY